MPGAKEVGPLKAKLTLDQVQFNQGIKDLSKQMSSVRGEFKLASASLDKTKDSMQLTQLTAKKLSDSIAIQKKIVEQYRQAYKDAASQYGVNSKEAGRFEQSLSKSEKQLLGMEANLKKVNKELQSHSLLSAKAADSIKNIGKAFDDAGKKMTSMGKSLSMTVTAPVIAAAAGLLKLATSAGEYGDTITKMSEKTGMSIQRLQELKFVTSNLDVDFETIQSTMSMMINKMKGLDTESSTFSEAVKELGISMTDSNGATKKAGDIYMEALMSLSQMTNETDRGVLASKMFGRSWMELVPLMNAGADGIAKLTQMAHDQGVVLSDESVIAADEYEHSMMNLKAQFQAVFFEIAQNFMPVIRDKLIPFIQKTILPALKDFGQKIGDVIAWFEGLDSGTQKLIGVMAGIVVAAGPALIVIGKLSTAISGLIAAFSFLMANPIVLAIGLIVAGFVALAYAAGSAQREVDRMTKAIIADIESVGEAQKKAIDAAYADRTAALDAEMAAEDVASNARLDQIQAEYDAEVKGMSKTESAMKKSLAERQKLLDDNHKKAIDAIDAEYGVFEEKQKSKTEIVQDEYDSQKNLMQEILSLSKDLSTQEGDAYTKTYNAIIEKARDIHDEKMAMYEQEYLKSIALINQDLNKTVDGYRDQIDALNKKTEEEDRLAREQEDAKKIADLQEKVRTATGYADFVKASQDLADEINRQNREKERENRQIQIDSLNDQIKQAQDKAAEDKQKALTNLNDKTGAQQVVIDAATAHIIAQIQAERIAKENAENKKYNAAKAALDKEEAGMDGWSDRYKAQLDKQLADKIAAEKAKSKAAKDAIAAEEQALANQKQQEKTTVDAQTNIRETQAKIDALNKRIQELIAAQAVAFMGGSTEASKAYQKDIDAAKAEIEKLRKELPSGNIGHFASGVVNYRGGFAQVNERGGEIQYLPRGTTVIPNDISMQMARSAGSSMTETNNLLRTLIGMIGSMPAGELNIDGNKAGEYLFNPIVRAGVRQGKNILFKTR